MAFFKGGKGSRRNEGDTKSSIPINQTAHGFTVPQAVYLDDGDGLYKLAKADVLATANAIGIVSSVQDVNNFTLTTAGAKNIFSGLTEGKTFYVSDTVAGATVDVRPSISRPILNAISATRGIIFIDAIGQAFAGGNDTEVQYNKSGTIAGDSSFTFDDATKLLTVEDVIIENDLTVKGTTTSVNSETVNIADNHIVLNAGNTTFTIESGGVVVNTGIADSPRTVTGSFTPGVASTSNPSVLLSGGSFATNDIVQVSGSLHNDGIYEVLSFAANVLTVRGIGNTPTVEDFTNNQFTTETAVGQIVKINATVLMANDDGTRKWGEATGSTTSIASPFVFDYFNEGNLPYVVGKAGGAIAYKYNTIQSAIDAVETAGADDTAIVVTPGTYTEDLTIASTTLSISSLGNEPDIITVVGDVTITSAAPISNSAVSILGITIIGSLTTAGTLRLLLTLERFRIAGTGTKVFDWGNTNTNSVLTAINSFFLEGGTATAAIERTAGSPSVVLTDCLVEGNFDFSAIAGGSIEASNLIVNDGSIDISNTTLTTKFFNLIVNTVGANPALDIQTTGPCVVIGGFLNVPSGGNAIFPASGADFTFANVATTSGTILTTAMGTRLATDGVTLKSDGTGLNDFLNDKGEYSVPNTIYTNNGIVSSNRAIEIPVDRNLNIIAFNNTVHSNSIREAQFVLKSNLVQLVCKVLDGAGNTVTFEGIELLASGMLVTDSTNTAGLKYAADYSGNFTARSLVDKGYVDASPTIFNTSGDITATRVIGAPQGRMISFNCFDVDNFGNSNKEGFVQVVNDDVRIGHLELDGAGGITGVSQLNISDSDMTIIDTINNKGFVYSQDYSSNFTDRSLIDKGYSDSGFLARSASGAANLTSSGKPILAVTDSSADRTVTIATADIEEGRQFIVKDEDGQAGTNMITVTTPTISVTSVAAGSSGSDFLTSTVHGYAIGQVVIHAGFSQGTYNGKFTVTDIVSTTRYEVAAITFVATGTGTSNIAIDGQASFVISVDYGSMEFYCTDNQVFTKGAGNVALATRSSTTGLLTGGEMSIVGGLPSNTLDISAATGQIVDHSDPASPVLTSVSIADDPTYTIANPTDGVFLIAIDANSSIVEIDLSTLTKEERHGHVIIGAYVATSGGGGGAVRILDEPVNVGYGISTALADFLADAIGPINMQGNTITGSVTDLSINTSAGTSYIVGQNYRVDPDCPNERSLPQATGFGFRRSFVDTGDVLGLESAGATFTEINPLMYNPTAGTVTAVANNNYTAQQVYLAPTGIYNVAYGQIQSTSESTIIDAVEDGTAFTEIEAFMDQVLIGIIVVQMTAGNLSNATFLQPKKFRMDVPA